LKSFSEKYGYAPEKEIQVDSMDDDLKRRISDVIYEHLAMIPTKPIWTGWVKRDVAELEQPVSESYWSRGITTLSRWSEYSRHVLMQTIKETSAHNKIYDLVLLIVQSMEGCADPAPSRMGERSGPALSRMNDPKSEFVDAMNAVLEENRSGWRIENDMIIPAIGEQELEAVRKAASLTEKNAQYVKMAMQGMSVSSPDYRGSIAHSAGMAESTLDKIGAEGQGVGTKLSSVVESLEIPHEIAESFRQMNNFANRFARHPNQKSDYEPDRDDAMLALVSFSAMSAYLHSRWKAQECKA